VRILLVSSLYPSAAEPDFGPFVKQLADELERQGHELARAVVDRRGGPWTKHVRLVREAVAAGRRFRPDVVYAHYLVPAGAVAVTAAAAAGAPLVATAHGRDVRNVDAIPGVAALTRLVVSRAARVVCVSDYLRRELAAKIPAAEAKTDVVDCGVDLERFRPRDAAAARAAVGWDDGGPFYLCVGALDERKNVVRLAEAFARTGGGTLAFVGDGPLRERLAGRPGIVLTGRVPHERVADWVAACDVLAQPSLVEPFGQALLEAMASGRSVVATRIGGPPEFVPPEAGVLVDPESVAAIADGLRAAARLPVPNAGARAAAEGHDVRLQAGKIAEILERARAEWA
jgi:glycosyltransferase involved in cell wall biosynthesis